MDKSIFNKELNWSFFFFFNEKNEAVAMILKAQDIPSTGNHKNQHPSNVQVRILYKLKTLFKITQTDIILLL